MEQAIAASRSRFLRPYRKLLLRKKAELLVALGINCNRLAQSEQGMGADPGPGLHEERVRLRLNRVLYGQIKQVEEALGRLELGEYGFCLDCGMPIPAPRLQAVPWAQYCRDCQEKICEQAIPEFADAGREA